VWVAPNLGKSTAKSVWDRPEDGCHSPLPKLRYGRLEEPANIRRSRMRRGRERRRGRKRTTTMRRKGGGVKRVRRK